MNIVYIDESGTPVISDQAYYVLCGVICKDNNINELNESIIQIKEKHGIGEELKSKSIGGNSKRRAEILESIAKLNISVVAIAVNKVILNSESGLRFKTSMYKYCQRKLFSKFYYGMQDIKIICDTYGSDLFMKSFENYLRNNFKTTIFSSLEFIYANPKQEALLQISDFIGGTIRRYKQGDDDELPFSFIKNNVIYLEEWPVSKGNNINLSTDENLDKLISEYAFKMALQQIENEQDPILKEFISYLAFDRYGENEFIFGDEILDHLKSKELIGDQRDKNWLMQNVVAPLRDNNAMIISSRDGYKIPQSRNDTKEFAEFVQEKTNPYLDRFQKI